MNVPVTWNRVRSDRSIYDDQFDIHRVVDHLNTAPYCLACGEDVENQPIVSMSGPGRDLWVHVDSGYASCYPGKKNSPSATPVDPALVERLSDYRSAGSGEDTNRQ